MVQGGSKSQPGALAGLCLSLYGLALLLFFPWQAHAKESNWLTESLEYVNEEKDKTAFSCAGCHVSSKDSTLRLEVPDSVASGDDSLTVRLSGFQAGNRLSSFRYRVGAGPASDTLDNVRPVGGQDQKRTITIPRDDSPVEVRYCLLDANDNERRWNCAEVSIRRQNSPPLITSLTPQDIIATIGDSPAEFVVTAEDAESIPDIVVRSDNSSAVTVDDTAAPLFRLNFVGIGDALIEIEARDSEGVSARDSFRVSVAAAPVEPPEPVNQPPELMLEATTDPLIMNIDDTIVLDVEVSDEQVASLRYRVSSSVETVATASFTTTEGLTIRALSDGFARIELEARDEGNRTASVAFSVQVLPRSEPPVARADVFVIAPSDNQVELAVLLNDTDSEGGDLSIDLVSAQSALGGSLRVDGRQVIYQPAAVLVEQDSFSYRAVNSANLRSEAALVRLLPSDVDGDGVVDALDNCLDLPNPDQNDLDSDNTGDLCDIDPDGDGTPGISGEPFVSGRDLVESECLSCHLNALNGAPRFNDKPIWDQRIRDAGGRPEDMLDSVVNGIPGAMEAFGHRFATVDLLRAVLYLSGREREEPEPPVDEIDTDSDGTPDSLDNCPTVFNPDQQDSDANELGDVCEPLADRDGDGYPYQIDDDDGNARRLIAALPVIANTSNTSVFTSDGALALGRVARRSASDNDYAKASIMLLEKEFEDNAALIFTGIEIVDDEGFSTLMGVMNIDAEAQNGVAEWILQLSTPLPTFPTLRTLNVGNGTWASVDQREGDALSSAAASTGRCPDSDSANYQPGVNAGDLCVRVRLSDGGRYDADQTTNGRVEFLGHIAAESQSDGSPPTVETRPSKSGGNAAGSLLLLLLAWLHIRALAAYWSRR